MAANAEGIADNPDILPDHRDRGFRGVAPGADLRMFAIELWSTGVSLGLYEPVTLQELGDYDDFPVDVFSHVLAQDVDIVNVSLGLDGLIDDYTEEEIRANFGDTVNVMAQSSATEKKILVWAAGNAHDQPCLPLISNCHGFSLDPVILGHVDAVSVEFLGGLPARIEELRGHSIAVVSVGRDLDGDGRPNISSFSNRCGIAAEWCIAAPGEDVSVALYGRIGVTSVARGIGPRDGTSFAAPMVAGGLALMQQLFRDQIPNTDLVERLLYTAAKDGPYADTQVYGQGLMDLGAATSPVGETMLAPGTSVDNRGYSLSDTVIRTGRAFGDGFTHLFAGQQIVTFDRLGAPFWYGLSDFAEARGGPAPRERLARLLSGLAKGPHGLARRTPPLSGWNSAEGTPSRGYRGLRLGIMDVPSGSGDSHFSLADGAATWTVDSGGGLNARALMTSGDVSRGQVSGFAISYRPTEALPGVRAGWLAESDTLLGTETGQAAKKERAQKPSKREPASWPNCGRSRPIHAQRGLNSGAVGATRGFRARPAAVSQRAIRGREGGDSTRLSHGTPGCFSLAAGMLVGSAAAPSAIVLARQ